MSTTYEVIISVNIGNASPNLGSLMKEINRSAASIAGEGMPQLSLRTNLPPLIITGTRELTPNEEETLKSALIAGIASDHPEWHARIESFRRQSGNVQQSAA